jgi:hypothetical protein
VRTGKERPVKLVYIGQSLAGCGATGWKADAGAVDGPWLARASGVTSVKIRLGNPRRSTAAQDQSRPIERKV